MGMNDIKNTNRTNRDLLCPRAHLGDRALVQRGMPHRVLAIAVRHLRARGGGHSPPSPRRTPRRAPTGRALVAPTHKIDPLLCLSSGRTRLGKRSLRVVFQDRFAPFDPGFDGCLLPARPIQVVGRIAPGSTPTPPADHIRGHGNGVTLRKPLGHQMQSHVFQIRLRPARPIDPIALTGEIDPPHRTGRRGGGQTFFGRPAAAISRACALLACCRRTR